MLTFLIGLQISNLEKSKNDITAEKHELEKALTETKSAKDASAKEVEELKQKLSSEKVGAKIYRKTNIRKQSGEEVLFSYK